MLKTPQWAKQKCIHVSPIVLVYSSSEIASTSHLCKNDFRISLDTLESDKFQLFKIAHMIVL